MFYMKRRQNLYYNLLLFIKQIKKPTFVSYYILETKASLLMYVDFDSTLIDDKL